MKEGQMKCHNTCFFQLSAKQYVWAACHYHAFPHGHDLLMAVCTSCEELGLCPEQAKLLWFRATLEILQNQNCFLI